MDLGRTPFGVLGPVVVVDGVALAATVIAAFAEDGFGVCVDHVVHLEMLRGFEAFAAVRPAAQVRTKVAVGVHLKRQKDLTMTARS